MFNMWLSDENSIELGVDEVERRAITVKEGADLWEEHIDSHYSEEDALTIHNLVSFMYNELNGFGHVNDPRIYAAEITGDPSGVLLEEARKGMFLLKKALVAMTMLKSHKYGNKSKLLKARWPRVLDVHWDGITRENAKLLDHLIHIR